MIYAYESESGKLLAICYYGKQSNPLWHYQFHSQEKRQKTIDEQLSAWDKSAAFKEEQIARKKAAAELPNPFQVGDILTYSWGWEQTQVEFYQVIATTKSTATIREIGAEITCATGSMSDLRIPVKGKFLKDSPPLTKRVSNKENGDPLLSMKHGIAHRWNGSPMHCSWYG